MIYQWPVLLQSVPCIFELLSIDNECFWQSRLHRYLIGLCLCKFLHARFVNLCIFCVASAAFLAFSNYTIDQIFIGTQFLSHIGIQNYLLHSNTGDYIKKFKTVQLGSTKNEILH